MKTGVELIAEERDRQVSQEGYTPEHDDTHVRGEIASAATTYAFNSTLQIVSLHDDPNDKWEPDDFAWPWRERGTMEHDDPLVGFKFSDDPVRNLVKAGALIAAEIDRINRAKVKTTECIGLSACGGPCDDCPAR